MRDLCWRLGFVALVTASLTADRPARGQAVAFAPTIGTIPDGVMLNVAPVVSADRRYVRLGANPVFIGFGGFEVVTVPAAVGGGGIGGGIGIGAGVGLPVQGNFALSQGSPFNPKNLTPSPNTLPASPVGFAAIPPQPSPPRATASPTARSKAAVRSKVVPKRSTTAKAAKKSSE